MSKTRILQTIGSMERGGIQSVLMKLIRNLDPSKYQFDFLVTDATAHPYDTELLERGSNIIACTGYRNPLQYAATFSEAVSRYGPYDVVHTHQHYFSGLAIWLALRHKIPIRIAHAHTDRRSLLSGSQLHRILYAHAMRGVIHQYATVKIAVSAGAASDLFGPDWSGHGVRIVINGSIDLSEFSAPVRAEAVRQSIGIPPGSLVLGHVGRFVHVKNHAHLLRVVAAAAGRDSRIRALLIGDGPLLADTRKLAADLHIADRVHFVGERHDVPVLLRTSVDAFVFPSFYEGLSNALIEAQAAALPCVISDGVGAETELIPPLIHRLSLDAPVSIWAEHVLNALERRSIPPSQALDLVAHSPFNSVRYAKSMADIFGGVAA